MIDNAVCEHVGKNVGSDICLGVFAHVPGYVVNVYIFVSSDISRQFDQCIIY